MRMAFAEPVVVPCEECGGTATIPLRCNIPTKGKILRKSWA